MGVVELHSETCFWGVGYESMEVIADMEFPQVLDI